jgi:hypothetical protein
MDQFYSHEQWVEAQEEQWRGLATPSQACREYACNAGADRPNAAWILTPWDTWEPNPHYQGPPQRHPEDFDDGDDETVAVATVATLPIPDDDIPF